MNLEEIAKKMCAKGKGILAADESTGTMDRRLNSVGVECTDNNRLNFRETLFTSEAMKSYIGGVILFDTTIREKASTGISISKLLEKNNVVVGIKVDIGAKKLASSPEETITEGLDGLRERLSEYYKLGARFTKWRAVFNIEKNYPSVQSLKSNAHALARYSALVQEANMVPIVEPEVLMEGDHNIDTCYKITTDVLNECFNELAIQKVLLKGIVLKPNMIVPGFKSSEKTTHEEIAKKTLDCLKKNVPSDVPGIAFLSGGQTEQEATNNLDAINKINDTNFLITFSYGRALQQSALKTWSKEMSNTKAIHDVFNHRAKMNGLASKGEWSQALEV
jgi:fructose-bisphosphate aldolase class I